MAARRPDAPPLEHLVHGVDSVTLLCRPNPTGRASGRDSSRPDRIDEGLISRRGFPAWFQGLVSRLGFPAWFPGMRLRKALEQ